MFLSFLYADLNISRLKFFEFLPFHCSFLFYPRFLARRTYVRLSLAREYKKDNASLGVTVSDVARYCHVSDRQLQRLFAAANDSAGACIRRERISAAEKLLGDTDLPLSEVAQRCGFGDEFYFGGAFKRENGMTPGAYRKAFGDKPTKRS